jgi:hypothetical protein
MSARIELHGVIRRVCLVSAEVAMRAHSAQVSDVRRALGRYQHRDAACDCRVASTHETWGPPLYDVPRPLWECERLYGRNACVPCIVLSLLLLVCCCWLRRSLLLLLLLLLSELLLDILFGHLI